MPSYGLLHTDRDGRLIERKQIECASDGDAVNAARELLTADGEVAIFQETRRVETLRGAAPLDTAAD
ncbi:MAG: hypothetical protein JNM30_19765 [Rhodospirillales bacterium]|nr:hypothetical protein [Rhodospirillales bacterium]